jgi:hypothetical protein
VFEKKLVNLGVHVLRQIYRFAAISLTLGVVAALPANPIHEVHVPRYVVRFVGSPDVVAESVSLHVEANRTRERRVGADEILRTPCS